MPNRASSLLRSLGGCAAWVPNLHKMRTCWSALIKDRSSGANHLHACQHRPCTLPLLLLLLICLPGADYMKEDYTPLLQRPPPGVTLNILRALRSDRWQAMLLAFPAWSPPSLLPASPPAQPARSSATAGTLPSASKRFVSAASVHTPARPAFCLPVLQGP